MFRVLSIASLAILYLLLIPDIAHAQSRRNLSKAVTYTVEIKDVVFSSRGTFAVVEVTRFLGDNASVAVTGDLDGTPNKDGPIAASLKPGQPFVLQLHWGLLSAPEPARNEKITVYLHPGGVDPTRPLTDLPQSSTSYVVVGPPTVKRSPPPPIPLAVDLVTTPHQPGNPHDAYITNGDSLTLTWTTRWPSTGCKSGIAMLLEGSDFSSKMVYQKVLQSGTGSQTLKPSTSPTYYTFSVSCSDVRATASQKITSTLYYPPGSPQTCTMQYCYSVTFPASNSCLAEARCSTSESEAQAIEKLLNPGATIKNVGCDLPSFSNACMP
jgi:hypothetical protein